MCIPSVLGEATAAYLIGGSSRRGQMLLKWIVLKQNLIT
jgi:hypothetical protein